MKPKIVSVVGYSSSGKTTLIEKLISELTRRGYRVGTIKHDAHGFEMDIPGKDSWRHKQAGASVTLISSPRQIGMVKDVDHDHSPEELLEYLSDMDLVLTEGYKRGTCPKIEVYRPELHPEPLCRGDHLLMAFVSAKQPDVPVPHFTPDDIKGIADLLTSFIHSKDRRSRL